MADDVYALLGVSTHVFSSGNEDTA